MKARLVAALVGFLLASFAQAEAPRDALDWLYRVAEAPRKLTYSGTFIYQSGTRTETSRIAHLVEGGNELERLEVLDGSPRQVLRSNDEVKCYLPETRLLIVEQRSAAKQSFPALLPGSLAGLSDHYAIRKGGTERVAGIDSQTLVIEPKDALRYGYKFWVDARTGMPLKAGLIDARGTAIETFTFTELRIGGPVDRKALRTPPKADGDWKVINVRTKSGGDEDWQFSAPLAGFRKVMTMRRQVRTGMPEMTHVVFSDGLAVYSVFIEPIVEGAKPEIGPFVMGTVNIFKRVIDGHMVVAMGDLPPASLKAAAEGVEMKKK